MAPLPLDVVEAELAALVACATWMPKPVLVTVVTEPETVSVVVTMDVAVVEAEQAVQLDHGRSVADLQCCQCTLSQAQVGESDKTYQVFEVHPLHVLPGHPAVPFAPPHHAVHGALTQLPVDWLAQLPHPPLGAPAPKGPTSLLPCQPAPPWLPPGPYPPLPLGPQPELGAAVRVDHWLLMVCVAAHEDHAAESVPVGAPAHEGGPVCWAAASAAMGRMAAKDFMFASGVGMGWIGCVLGW